MGKEEVGSTRADAARRVSSLMMNPAFHRNLAQQDLLDEDGEIPMVVAGADESAVVTIHRMDRIKAPHVVVATYMDERIGVIVMKRNEVAATDEEAVDIVGGMTVRDWFEMIELNRGRTYHASGSDIMSAIDSTQYAVS